MMVRVPVMGVVGDLHVRTWDATIACAGHILMNEHHLLQRHILFFIVMSSSYITSVPPTHLTHNTLTHP